MALYRDSASYVLGRAGPALIGLATTAVYTRLVPPDELGSFVLALSAATLANSILFQWLGTAAVRFAPPGPADRRAFLTTVQLTWTALAAMALSSSFAVWWMFAGHPAQALIVPTAAALCGLGVFELHLTLLRSSLAPGRYGITVALRAVLTLLCVWEVARLGYGGRGLLLGFTAGWILAPLPTLRFAWRSSGSGGYDPSLARRLLLYGLPLMLTVSFESSITTSDRLLVGWLRGSAEAGLYGVAAMLTGNTLLFLLNALTLATLPLAVRALETTGIIAAREELRRGLRVLLAAGIPAAVGFALLAGNIAHVVLGVRYRSAAVTLLPPLAIATLLNGLRVFYLDHSFQLGHRTDLQIRIAGIAAVVACAGNLLVIPRWGAHGAAWILVGSYGLALIASWRLGRRVFALPGPGADLARIGGSAAVMALALLAISGARGPTALVAQVIVGAVVYGAGLFVAVGSSARSTLRRLVDSRRGDLTSMRTDGR